METMLIPDEADHHQVDKDENTNKYFLRQEGKSLDGLAQGWDQRWICLDCRFEIYRGGPKKYIEAILRGAVDPYNERVSNSYRDFLLPRPYILAGEQPSQKRNRDGRINAPKRIHKSDHLENEME